MYPEPKFGMEYRALIETYRLAPETAACQLDEIIQRLCGGMGYPSSIQTERGCKPS